jgi:hypothetical protein
MTEAIAGWPSIQAAPNTSGLVVRTYTSPAAYQHDAVVMAEAGYFPIQQTTSRGSRYGLLLALGLIGLLLFFVGVLLLLLWAILHRPDVLTVTYEYRQPA